MDIESYNKVINGIQQSEDPNTTRKKSRSGFTRAEIAFKKDLLRDKIVWYNDKKKDWKCYVRLNHPALSICRVPKEHPFGKCERFVAFMIDFGLSAVFAFIVNMITSSYCKDPSTADSDPYYEYDDRPECTEGAFPPMEVLLYGQLYSLGFSIFNAISNGSVRMCSTCACCQKNSCPKCCRKCFECIGCGLSYLWLAVVGFLCVMFGMIAWWNDMFIEFMLNFAGGRIFSWIWVFILLRCCFNKKWKKEKANKGKKLNKLKITYIDYELYVNGKQVEIPPNYIKPRRTSTVGSINELDGNVSVPSGQTPPTPHVVQVQMQQMHELQVVTTNQMNGRMKESK